MKERSSFARNQNAQNEKRPGREGRPRVVEVLEKSTNRVDSDLNGIKGLRAFYKPERSHPVPQRFL